jgi:hypothetical protein
MRPGSAAWWAGKIRQARAFGRASVGAPERAGLEAWLTAPQLRLFDGMHIADRRHGLDVVAWLRAHRESDPEVLLAGLLHDAGKGNAGFLARVVYSLSQAYGDWVVTLATVVPSLAKSVTRLRAHAALSVDLAQAAGCSPRTLELIGRQDEPPATEAARRLHLADEAS